MSSPSGEQRPFHDPHHPSWYSGGRDSSSGSGSSAANSSTGSAEPQAQQAPLANPYEAQGQYPGYGTGYPPVAQPPQVYGYDARTPVPGQRPGASGLSIASMICRIAGLVSFGAFFVPQILAVVFGHIGLRQDRERGQPAGFAMAGLTTGYLGLALIAVIWLFILGASF